jgi:hypothetical protein
VLEMADVSEGGRSVFWLTLIRCIANMPIMEREFLKGACPTCGGDGAIRLVNPAWLVAQRKRAGVTQSAMADRLHWSKAYLCDMEKGRRAVPAVAHEAYRKLR